MSLDDIRRDQRPRQLLTNPEKMNGLQVRVPGDVYMEETLKPGVRAILKNNVKRVLGQRNFNADHTASEKNAMVADSFELREKGEALTTNPVYNTLPPNSGNFNFVQQVTVVGNTATLSTIFTRQAPDGKILYLRDVRVNITDSFNGAVSLGIPDGLISYSIFVNGNSTAFNQNITVEPLDNFNPVHIIANQNDTIEVKVSFDFSALGTPPTSVLFLTHLRGDLLAPNDAAIQYTALASPSNPK